MASGHFFSERAYEQFSLAPSFYDICKRARSAPTSIQAPQRHESKKFRGNEKLMKPNEDVASKNREAVVSSLLPTPRVPYPRYSWLSLEEHSEYKRLLKSQKQWDPDPHRKLSRADAKNMERFKKLHQLVLKEQEEYLSFLCDVSTTQMSEYKVIPSAVVAAFKSIVQCQAGWIRESYPHFYQLLDTVSLDCAKPPDQAMTFVKTALKRGETPQLFLPRPSSTVDVQNLIPNFDLPISNEAIADQLAKQHKVDIVITTESLSKLADNQLPDYGQTWQIPMTVKQLETDSHKCVFVDNPIILSTLTGRQQSQIVFDQLLRQISLQREICITNYKRQGDSSQETLGINKEMGSGRAPSLGVDSSSDSDSNSEFGGFDLSSDLTTEEVRVLSSDETDFELQIVTGSDRDDICQNTEDSTQGDESSVKLGGESTVTHFPDKLEDPPEGQTFVYNLWKFGELTLLIRSTGDGTVIDKRMKGKVRRVFVVPKVEFQAEFGYEVMTQSECADWWMGSFLRPRSHVTVVHVNGFSSEVLQCDQVDIESIAGMAKKDCCFSLKQSMEVVLFLLKILHRQSAGKYLICHTAGASEVRILESTTTVCHSSDDVFDLWMSSTGGLDTQHESDASAISWLPVSVHKQSAHQKRHNLIPATFPSK